MNGFKEKSLPEKSQAPKPIKAPAQKALVPYAPGVDDAIKQQSPDGPRAGFATMPSGRREFKAEIPFPPAKPIEHKPFKEKKA